MTPVEALVLLIGDCALGAYGAVFTYRLRRRGHRDLAELCALAMVVLALMTAGALWDVLPLVQR
ncbi:hypothetical protein [Streptomyces fagopyri]|uniref:hypothetical protein n=1 Tax=Streptomyces fagopyri TaxID=2662397 RepID=UPI003801F09F